MDLKLKEQYLLDLRDIISTVEQINTNLNSNIDIQAFFEILKKLERIENEKVFMNIYTDTMKTLIGILTATEKLSSDIYRQNLELTEQIDTHHEKENIEKSILTNNFIF